MTWPICFLLVSDTHDLWEEHGRVPTFSGVERCQLSISGRRISCFLHDGHPSSGMNNSKINLEFSRVFPRFPTGEEIGGGIGKNTNEQLRVLGGFDDYRSRVREA